MAGTCNSNGIVLRLTPEIRQWVGLKGCCSFRRPSLIDADTQQAADKIKVTAAMILNTPFADDGDRDLAEFPSEGDGY